MGTGQSSAGGSRDSGVHSGKRKKTNFIEKSHPTAAANMRFTIIMCLRRVV